MKMSVILSCLLSCYPITSYGQALPEQSSGTYLGITPNRFATDPETSEVFLERFQQTLDAGVTFVVGGASWAELEPADGRYDIDNIKYLVWAAANVGLPVSYTVRIIDNVRRGVPQDLQNLAFDDPRVVARMLRLIDTIVPLMRGQVRWFTFGYEIDPYFERHPDEIQGFVYLHQIVAARVKELAPEIPVGSTLTFSGIDQLNVDLWQLNQQLDFVGLTYCPFYPGFTVMDPTVVATDFARMTEIAAGRKIVLEEVAYPSAALNNSSGEKQADFYRAVFEQLQIVPNSFDAVNIMILADLSDQVADAVAQSYGLDMPPFKSALQTLGLFDGLGQPKPAWSVVVESFALQSLRKPRLTTFD